MTEAREDNVDPAEGPNQCQSSLKDHVETIAIGMALGEVNTGCYKTYQAIMDVAEYIRQERNFPKYEATGDTMRELAKETIERMNKLEAEELAREKAAKDSNKTLLTPDERKRMN